MSELKSGNIVYNIVKNARLLISITALLIFVSAFCVPAYGNAADLNTFNEYIIENDDFSMSNPPLENVSILSGVSKPVESTFDAIRTIVGSAPKDTVVTIAVYVPDTRHNEHQTDNRDENKNSFALCRTYVLTVGQSGMFSKTIDIEKGRNFLCVMFSKDGESAVTTAIINRKDIEIKKELEQGGVLNNIDLLQIDSGKNHSE